MLKLSVRIYLGLLLLIFLGVWQADLHAFVGGSGTANDPWQIGSARDLSDMRSYPGQYFCLVNDIYLDDAPFGEGEGWIPVGDLSTPFTGHLSGKHNGIQYTIHNLFINRPETDYQGLFGYTQGGSVQNLRIVGANVSGGGFTGILAGIMSSMDILYDCYVEGTVLAHGDYSGLLCGLCLGDYGHYYQASAQGEIISSGSYTGGLVGKLDNFGNFEHSRVNAFVTATGNYVGGMFGVTNFACEVYYCKYYGVVNGESYVGGLIGLSDFDTWVRYSFASAMVVGNQYVGGLAGFLGKDSCMRNSFARGTVLGQDCVGGFAGAAVGGACMFWCYSYALVNGASNVGGFIGDSNIYGTGAPISSCYWDIETSGQTSSDGGLGRTTAQMTNGQTADTYVDWDFATIWAHDVQMLNNGYPMLQSNPVSTPQEHIPAPQLSLTASPNPFRDYVKLELKLNTPGSCTLDVYNLKGQKQRSFVSSSAGQKSISLDWDGRDEDGKLCPSGVYIVRLRSGKQSAVRKITLIR